MKCFKDTAPSNFGKLYTITGTVPRWMPGKPGEPPARTQVAPLFCRRLFPTQEIMLTYVNEGWFHGYFIEISEEEACTIDAELVSYTIVAAAEATIISRQHKTPTMRAPSFSPYHAFCYGSTFGFEQTSRILKGSLTQEGYTMFRACEVVDIIDVCATCPECGGLLTEPPLTQRSPCSMSDLPAT